MLLLPTKAKLWGIFSLTHHVGRGSSEASATTCRGTEALGKDVLGRTHKEHRFRAFFLFGVIYFFKPTCSLGSAGKQDIPREGRWSREQDSAAALAGSPRPLLPGGRSRQAPSRLRRGRQPFCASVPSRGKLSSLGSASSQAQPEVSQKSAQQLRDRTPRGKPESLSHEERWLVPVPDRTGTWRLGRPQGAAPPGARAVWAPLLQRPWA